MHNENISKLTPGPWIEEPLHDTPVKVPGRIAEARKGGRVLAHVQPLLTKEEQSANARLIAAAPELLEELKDIVKYWEEFEHDYTALGALEQALLYSARIAVQKAEGVRE